MSSVSFARTSCSKRSSLNLRSVPREGNRCGHKTRPARFAPSFGSVGAFRAIGDRPRVAEFEVLAQAEQGRRAGNARSRPVTVAKDGVYAQQSALSWRRLVVQRAARRA